MNSQWENFLKNLGDWQGFFTEFSPQGERIRDIPSHLTLESLNQEQTVRLTLKRFYPNSDPTLEPEVKELVREYKSLERDILFFEKEITLDPDFRFPESYATRMRLQNV